MLKYIKKGVCLLKINRRLGILEIGSRGWWEDCLEDYTIILSLILQCTFCLSMIPFNHNVCQIHVWEIVSFCLWKGCGGFRRELWRWSCKVSILVYLLPALCPWASPSIALESKFLVQFHIKLLWCLNEITCASICKKNKMAT